MAPFDRIRSPGAVGILAVCALALFTVLTSSPEPAAARESHFFRGERSGARSYAFATTRLRPSAVLSAQLRIGPTRSRVPVRQVRRAFGRGRLQLRLSRRAIANARRWRPRLVVVTRAFPYHDGYSTLRGTLRRTGTRAYDGSTSIVASYDGERGTTFQRVWRDVHWHEGSDVWYGMALFITDPSAYCYWNPIRWDNYKTFGPRGDVGGLAIENGRLNVIRGDYGGVEQKLIEGVPVPANRWFWVELHQHLSAGFGGMARTELYVDGQDAGVSVAPNSRGRRIDDVRFGVVDLASSCSRPGSIFFDRTTVSDRPSGPLGAPFVLR